MPSGTIVTNSNALKTSRNENEQDSDPVGPILK